MRLSSENASPRIPSGIKAFFLSGITAQSVRKRTEPDPDGDAKTRAPVKPKKAGCQALMILSSLMKKLRWGLQSMISATIYGSEWGHAMSA